MVDYDSLQATVYSKIVRYGADMTLRVGSHRDYNAAIDAITEGIDDYVVQGIFTEFSEGDIDGTRVQTGDRRILLHALGGIPDSLERVEDLKIIDSDDRLWNIISIKPLSPGGITLLYKVHVRP